jgi:hypothetical protein
MPDLTAHAQEGFRLSQFAFLLLLFLDSMFEKEQEGRARVRIGTPICKEAALSPCPI